MCVMQDKPGSGITFGGVRASGRRNTANGGQVNTLVTDNGLRASNGVGGIAGAAFDPARIANYNKAVDAQLAKMRGPLGFGFGGPIMGSNTSGQNLPRRLQSTGEFQGFRMDGAGNVYGLVGYEPDKNPRQGNMFGNNQQRQQDQGKWFRLEGFKLDKSLSSGDVEVKQPPKAATANLWNPSFLDSDVNAQFKDDLSGVGAWRDIELRQEADGTYMGVVKGNSSSGEVGYIRQAIQRERAADDVNLSNRSGTTRSASRRTNRTVLTS